MSDHLTLAVKNSMEELPLASEAASRWISEQKLSPRIDYVAGLSIEELVTNCIKYAYDDNEVHLIAIELRLADTAVVLTITDDGRPFDPLKAPTPNLDLPIEERPLGGLGIHLLRNLCQRVEYARVDGRNRVTLWIQGEA